MRLKTCEKLRNDGESRDERIGGEEGKGNVKGGWGKGESKANWYKTRGKWCKMKSKEKVKLS